MLKKIIVLVAVLSVVVTSIIVIEGGNSEDDSGTGLYVTFTKEWPGSSGKGNVKLYKSAKANSENIKGVLRCDKYGNLRYKVLSQKDNYLYVKIRTKDFGYGWVYTERYGTYTTSGRYFRYVAPTGSKSKRYEYIFGNNTKKYKTKKESLANMKDLDLKVWKVDSKGKKYSSKVYVTVNKKLEGTVRTIFEEIYESDEKFPIKNIGGWRWPSEHINHPSGTAVDINWEENYYKKGNTTIGKFWNPYKNIYSIPKNSSVVKIFKKYGWDWGGDWKSLKDYMHFSYLGG